MGRQAQHPRHLTTVFVCLGLICLLCLGALPAAALEEVTVEFDPLQPQLGRDFTAVVQGLAEGPVTLESVQFGTSMFDDEELVLRIEETGCIDPCEPTPFRLDVPIDGSLPFEEQEIYTLLVREDSSDEILFGSVFAMGRTYFHVLRPEVRVDPLEPTDNDHVQLLIASEPNVCGPSRPELERLQRSGKSIRIFLEFSSGFGPAAAGTPAATPSAAEKCTPAVPYLDSLAVDLGELEAGNYAYEVYLRERNGGTLHIRTNRGNFEVADASSVVRLQNDRFEVNVEWTDFEGVSGNGEPVPVPGGATDSTLFTFFDPDNWEALVKVLDGCTINGHYWVFTAAATTVEYTITVTDTQTGQEWSFDNTLGVQSPAVTDTLAFACSP